MMILTKERLKEHKKEEIQMPNSTALESKKTCVPVTGLQL